MNSAIVFWLTITMPGSKPITFEHPVESLAACLFETHEVLARPSHTVLLEGGTVKAGCSLKLAPSIEH